ncbi:hypothetical protein JCM16358_09730 [Halanaerocella petrolearia]
MTVPSTGIIFEGIPATGKSTIIRSLLKSPKILEREFMPFLTYGEDITQRVLEKKYNQGQLTKEDNLELLFDIIEPLEKYKDYYQKRGWVGTESEHRYAFVLERFHITHATYFDHLCWDDLAEIDRKLAQLNTKLCFLEIEPKVMRKRIIYSRGQKWRNYISRYGSTEEEIIEHYIRRQKRKKQLVTKSNLPSLILNTSQANWEQLIDQMIEFWDLS